MKRIVNFVRITFSYLLSVVLRRAIHQGKPVSVSLEPVNLCNLRCPECPTGRGEITRQQGSMETGMFENILEQIGPQLAWVNLYFQGEPYLNPGFLEMASIARARNLHVVSSTNGHFLTPDTARKTVRSGLDKLIVSLDGATQESYSAYRTGGRLEKVIEGLKHLADAKEELGSKRPKVVVQCLLLKTNLHEQDQVRQIVKNAKADKVEFKTAQFYDFEKGNVLMPEGKYSRYRVDQSTSRLVTTSPHYVLNNKLRNSCFRMWSSCVITWDGLVVPCCFDKDAGHVMGDLKVQPFEEIWNGEKYRAFRKKILQDRKSMDICRNCSQKF